MERHGLSAAPASGARIRTIFDLLTAYHRSLENMKSWLNDAPLSSVERIGIIDAWQDEMREFFAENGYCFACNRRLERCRCEESSSPASD